MSETYEPTIESRCPQCRMAHYDQNFATCRSCGAALEVA